MPLARFFFVTALILVLAECRKPPGEPDLVLRADTVAGGQSLSGSDSSGCASADSVPPEDSIPRDTMPEDTLQEVPADPLPGARCARLELRGSLYGSLAEALPGEDTDVLGAHAVRCMWWNLDPWRGLSAGDSLVILFGAGDMGLENRTIALRYTPVAGSSNRAFSVYMFRKTGDSFPSYFYQDGTEAVKLLDVMPLTTFEEVTGIYGEPRGDHTHAGIDFKAPEGTPVRTAHGGVVARTDWNTEYNGHCVEIRMGAGYSEIFLHLRDIAPVVSPGASVPAGTTIGTVGNTGRSYSAHLHYQINDECDRPIDPCLFFGTHRRSLGASDMPAFQEFVTLCDSLMLARGSEP
ncbi:M23 family metallopeptidase [Candidatus Fermentibacteria bacterium]|nr:M23 family metallopeptidase [Candidatus Fermentibacteria bacterium]